MIPRSLTEGTRARFWPRKGTLTSGIFLILSCCPPFKVAILTKMATNARNGHFDRSDKLGENG